jgi:hypothetical protein
MASETVSYGSFNLTPTLQDESASLIETKDTRPPTGPEKKKCTICDEEKSLLKLCDQSHASCADCLKGWVVAQMSGKILPIRCLQIQCVCDIYPSVLKTNLPSDTFTALAALTKMIEERRQMGPRRSYLRDIEPDIRSGSINLCPACQIPTTLGYGCNSVRCDACGRRFVYDSQQNCICGNYLVGCYCSPAFLCCCWCPLPFSFWCID